MAFTKSATSPETESPTREKVKHPTIDNAEQDTGHRGRGVGARGGLVTCLSGRPKGVKETIASWAASSSCNGIPHTVGEGGTLKKVCWLLLVLTGAGLTIWQCILNIQTYFTYPYNIAVSIDFKVGMAFPAVTICNTNQIRKSALPELKPILGSIFPQQYGQKANYSQVTIAGQARTREAFDRVWVQVNDSVKEWAGHQKETTILDCVFDGQPCGPENFTLILNPVFGNCYTFNTGINNKLLKIYKPGPTYGLMLQLFPDQENYITELTDHAGIKTLVHHQEEMPFPEDEGFVIPPGFHSLVNTRENLIVRLPSPYPSGCVNLEPEESELYSVYSEIIPYVEYSLEGCMKTCYQATVISQCLCGDPQYPLDGYAVKSLLNKSEKTRQIKPCATIKEEICENGVRDKARNNLLNCSCSLPCKEVEYLTSMSSSEWPIPSIQKEYYKALAEQHPHIAYIFNTSLEISPRSNLVKLSVFFEELNRELIQEKKAMSPSSLFSAVGGIFGFYLGLSIVAMFEFAELIFDLLNICVMKHLKS